MDQESGGQGGARHVPVLLDTVLEYLTPRDNGYFLDGTLGLGGHSLALLEKTHGRIHLLGLDRDEEALATARERLAGFAGSISLHQSEYSRFPVFLEEMGWPGLDGALLDLGVSSMQLDEAERGFSFIKDGPLDMRMGSAGGSPPASRLVNKWSLEKLKKIIGAYGEEPMGGRIARAIIEARREKPITTTLELATIVEQAYPAKMRAKARNHPATRTFQALRMAVNRELDELADFLQEVTDYLRPGGRVGVISYHSLEDRRVKRHFRDEAQGCRCPRQQPVCVCGHVARLKVVTRKPLVPGEEEVAANSRARSAKFRVAEKLVESGKE